MRRFQAAAAAFLVLAAVFVSAPAVTLASADGCPAQPSLENLRLMRAAQGPACYGHRDLTFEAFAPRTDGIGGVGYQMNPAWLGPFAGGLLQQTDDVSNTHPAYGNGPMYHVFFAPSLGDCSATYPESPGCPLHGLLNQWVTVTGHFDDAVAPSCHARGVAHPDRQGAIAVCRQAFVITAISAALPPTSTTDPVAGGGAGLPASGAGIGIWAGATALIALVAVIAFSRRRRLSALPD